MATLLVRAVDGILGTHRCMVELTEIRVRGETWWSVGFEATGPIRLLRGALEHTADLVFARALPPEVQFSLETPSPTRTGWASAQPSC